MLNFSVVPMVIWVRFNNNPCKKEAFILSSSDFQWVGQLIEFHFSQVSEKWEGSRLTTQYKGLLYVIKSFIREIGHNWDDGA